MRSRFCTLVLFCLTITGCTTGVVDIDDLPTAPSPPPVRAVKLTITPLGGGTILTGDSAPVTTSGGLPANAVALGAFAEFSNGAGRYVEAVWTSSDDSVIGVIDNRLVGRSHGNATLTATFEGQIDTETFTVGSGIFGRWSGTYVVEQCVANSGAMDDVLCRPPSTGRTGIAPIGATLPFTMEITAAGGDDITGRIAVGTIAGVLNGKNRGGGYFHLAGVISGRGGAINIVEWNMRAVNDGMDGVLSYELKLDGVTGIGAVGARLRNMTRQ